MEPIKNKIASILVVLSLSGAHLKMERKEVIKIYEDERGRIIASNSLTYLDDEDRYGFYPVTDKDIIIGGSFAGTPTFMAVLALGVKGVIAHECGVGKNQKAIEGVFLAQHHGIPAAAVATHSAIVSDGISVSEGIVSVCNETAKKLGVSKGMKALDAAKLMLDAKPGVKVEEQLDYDDQITIVEEHNDTKVYTVWSIGLIKEKHPNAIFCVASHSGAVMAEYTLPVNPKLIFANDAGIAKDSSGVAGLHILNDSGIAAVAVAAMSAEIGSPTSTYQDGICSVVNARAYTMGIRKQMTVKEAIDTVLKSRY